MKIEEITKPEDQAPHLRKGGLDIIIAGLTEDGFQAAHGKEDSVLVLHMQGKNTVWVLTEAPKEHRKEIAGKILARLVEHGAQLGDY